MPKDIVKKATGRPVNQRIRWTIDQAAKEFAINPKTLAGRLNQAQISPEPDGRFATLQIVRAIYNDLEAERIRLTRAQADGEEIKNQELLGRLVDADEFSKRWEGVFVSVVRIIKNSKLTEDEQIQLQTELASVLK